MSNVIKVDNYRRPSIAISPTNVHLADGLTEPEVVANLVERRYRSSAPSPEPRYRMTDRRRSSARSTRGRKPGGSARPIPNGTLLDADANVSGLDMNEVADESWTTALRRTFGSQPQAAPEDGWGNALRRTFGPAQGGKISDRSWTGTLRRTFGDPTKAAAQDGTGFTGGVGTRRGRSKLARYLRPLPDEENQSAVSPVPLLLLVLWSVAAVGFAAFAVHQFRQDPERAKEWVRYKFEGLVAIVSAAIGTCVEVTCLYCQLLWAIIVIAPKIVFERTALLVKMAVQQILGSRETFAPTYRHLDDMIAETLGSCPTFAPLPRYLKDMLVETLTYED